MNKQQGNQDNSGAQERPPTGGLWVERELFSGAKWRFNERPSRVEGRFSGAWPLCLLGPGEGYYRPWPGSSFQPGQVRRAIGQRLRRIWFWIRGFEWPSTCSAEAGAELGTVKNPLGQMAREIRTEHVEVLQKDLSQEARPMWLRLYGEDRIKQNVSRKQLIRKLIHERDSQATRHSASNSRFSVQSWLFPDDAGIGRPSRRKQGHRVSTHRSPVRKGTYSKVSTQGTLFGLD